MATKTVLKALTDYFQDDAQGSSLASDGGDTCAPTVGGIPGKRPAAEWRKEVLALDTEDRKALAELVCAATGDTLQTK